MIHARLHPVWPPSVREPSLQGLSRGSRPFRRPPNADLTTGMKREEVGHVPMARLHLLIVLRPLLDLAERADLRPRDFLQARA